MDLNASLRESVSRVLLPDDIDVGVAVVRYSIEDRKCKRHPKNYKGLTREEIERRLKSDDIETDKNGLQVILGNLYSNALITCKKNTHYGAASKFKSFYQY